MLVSQILKTKGDLVFTAAPSETLGAICALLHSRRVGAMVVTEGDQVVGIVSERDIVREVMGVLDVIRQRGEERLYDVLLRKGLLAASAREDTVRVIQGGKARIVRI